MILFSGFTVDITHNASGAAGAAFQTADHMIIWTVTHWHGKSRPLCLQLGQSESAEALPYSDSLSGLQVKTKVSGSLKQQNDGGAQVKLPHGVPLL